MSDRDEHLEVLRAMWGEMKTLNSRINHVNESLCARSDTTNVRLEEIREYLGSRIDATNQRLDGTNDRLDAQTAELKTLVASSRVDRQRLDRLESRVDALEQRTSTPTKPPRRPRR
jgi:hypothetical protein